MNNYKHTLFPITINYNGTQIKTKALKYAYNGKEYLYKIVLPSIMASINQCWFSRINTKWDLVMGQDIDQSLIKTIITAIENYEKSPSLYPADTRMKLKSA